MQASKMLPAVALVGLTVASADSTNPMAKVLELMDDCSAKITKDGEAEAKAYKEYFEWCDDASKDSQFAIKTYSADVEKLSASVAKLTSDIEVGTSKIEDLAAAIATAEKDLADATAVREKEAADFSAAEAELVDGVDTLGRAIGILEREMAKNPAAFAQIDMSSFTKLTQAIGAVTEAAAFTASDKSKLMALVQSADNSDDDDDEQGAPAPNSYESHSGGIVDVLNGMKEKAEGELKELRKAESNAAQNFNMLKGSLEGQIGADTKDMEEEKSTKAANEEQKATDSGDLAMTEKDLAEAQASLAKISHDCLQTAADHEATVAAREEELKVIATAKKILQETSSGAVSQSYDFLQMNSQMRTRTDLIKTEVLTAVKGLARRSHSAALAQLASKMSVVMQYGGANQDDVFAKIKGLVQDMIAKLEKEAEEDAAEKAYCDEEMAKTEAKKQELDDEIAKLTSKIDKAAAKSTRLKGEVKEAQATLAALAKTTAEMNKLRQEQNADYKKAKADLELGLGGVQKALEVLREYYGGAAAMIQSDSSFSALMQQPAKPAKHEKSSGAGGSIIGILEVCESDFSKNLAAEEAQESDSLEAYEQLTQENKITKATNEQDVKYKTQEFKGLDKEITEITSDKETSGTELAAVMEYYGKIKDRCVAKPETYEERTKRRNAEIEGLKQSLQVLDEQTAFVQRKRRGVRGAIQ
jgi:chromosome segregation ATPase